MRLRVGKRTHFIAKIIPMYTDLRITRDFDGLMKHFLMRIFERVQHELVRTIAHGHLVQVFSDVANLEF